MDGVTPTLVMAFMMLGTAVLWAIGRTYGAKVGNRVAADLLRGGATLLDVRTAQEFASGHAPGAKNVPVGELTARMTEVPPGVPVVVYCRSGARASAAAKALRAAGYSAHNVFTLSRARDVVAAAKEGA